MLRLAAKRILLAGGILLAASVVLFVLMALMPGDAAEAVLGREATPEKLEMLRQQFGLNQPLFERYWDWLTSLLGGDLGNSITTDARVSELLGERVRNSAVLAGLAIVILIPVSMVLGIVSALRRDSWLDHFFSSSSLLVVSTPEFVFGTLLILVFSFGLGWFPAASLVDGSIPLLDQINVLVLPVLTLVGVAVAQATRMIRASMIEALDKEYVQVARMRGMSTRTVALRYAFPNALAPTIQILALTVGWLVSGVVVTEALFQYPGLGLAFADAVQARDWPTVQVAGMIVTGVYVVTSLVGDLLIMFLDPRLRKGASKVA